MLAAAVVAVLAVGGVTAWRMFDRTPAFTFAGQPIAQPMSALKQAEASVFALTSKQPTVTGTDNRCYYAVPDIGTSAQRRAVDQAIYWGPLAFLDGAKGDNFLYF